MLSLTSRYLSKKLVIGFYGGEPLINFDLIKKCVEYAKSIFCGKKLLFNITTNGTLMTDEICEFIVENSISVLFSIDGPSSVHDVNRQFINGKGSFEKTYAALKQLTLAYGDMYQEHISINMVFDPRKDPSEAVKFIDMDFIKSHSFSISAGGADDTFETEDWEVSEEYIKFTKKWNLICLFSLAGIISEEQVPSIFSDYIYEQKKNISVLHEVSLPLTDIGAPTGPCIPGKRKMFVNTEGSIYPCERVSEVSTMSKIGDLENGIDIEKSKQLLNIASISPTECSNCYCLRHCKICISFVEDKGDLSVEKRKAMCDECKTILDNSIEASIFISEYKKKRSNIA